MNFKIYLLPVLIAFTITACSSTRYIYTKPIEVPVQTLNPKLTRMRVDFMITKTIFGQLLTYNTTGNIQPGIFHSWKISEDGKTYLFAIDPKTTFHDGSTVTLEDVIFTFQFLAAKDSLVSRYFSNIIGFDEFISGQNSSIIGIKKISTTELEIQLKNKSFIFLAQLADPKIVLLPYNLKGMNEVNFFEHPIGAGAYKLKSMDAAHTHLVLEKFEGYFGEKSNIKIFDIKVYQKETAINLFQKGNLDDIEAYFLEPKEIDSLKDFANLYSVSSYSINLLLINGRKKIFQNKNVRSELSRSINLALASSKCDKQAIITTGIIPLGLSGWTEKINENIKPLNRTIEKHNQKALKIFGYGHKPPQCVLDKVMEGIEQQTNFTASFNFQDEDKAVETFLSGDYDLYFEDLSVRGPEPFNIFTFFDPKSPHNLTWFNDPNISNKLTDIESMIRGQRAIAYSELSHYISQEQFYVIPLYTQIRIFLFNKRIKSDEVPAILHGNTPFEKINL